MKIQDFFQLPDGRTARLYSLRNSSGFGADITDFGGAIVRLLTPDRNGKLVDVVLGFAEPADYIENGPFFGALIGRVANRISNGRFTLDGKTYICDPEIEMNYWLLQMYTDNFMMLRENSLSWNYQSVGRT